MNLKGVFKRLGLGKNSHLVYEVLLKMKKPMLVSHIATNAGIDRPEVYRNLRLCIKKELIEKITVGKRTFYTAQSPRRIQHAFNKVSDEVQSFVNDVYEKEQMELPKHIIYFKGAKGIRAMFDDVIDRMPAKGTFYRYTSERNLEEVNQYLSLEYRKRRDKKKLERLVISNPISAKAKKPRLERFIKFFPPEIDLFDQNIIQLVYADTVGFINLSTKEGYIIRDENLAQFQTVIFKQLYRKL